MRAGHARLPTGMPNPYPDHSPDRRDDRRSAKTQPDLRTNPAITSKERDIPDKKKPAPSLAAPLNAMVFNPGKEAIFPVTLTIVYGSHEAMLVDAHF